MAPWRHLVLAALIVALAPLLPRSAQAVPDATVRTTEHGIPHIVARDDRGLGYGYGYVVARDNLCLLAESYVTVAGERSKYFGADGEFHFHANGATHQNLASDFYYRGVLASGVIERQLKAKPPVGVRRGVRYLIDGYVQGYNRYLKDIGGPSAVRDPACRGRDWVKPITRRLAYARFMQLASLAGGGLAVTGVGQAQPPPPGGSAAPRVAAPEQVDELGRRLGLGGLGSNALALGSQSTRSGAGMVLGNPHLPWLGDYRLYQAHFTIPGRLDAQGATFIGVPLILIGHNRKLAWSHTTSSAFRFTPVEVRLVPGRPTSYFVDGQPQEMSRRRLTVPVRRSDNSAGQVTRTLYSTRYGPMFTELLGLKLFPWTPSSGYAFHDVNAENLRYLNHFYEADRARSVDELAAILRRNEGLPWANTVAADASGRTLYADIGAVPHVTDRKARRCDTALGAATFARLRLPILDGSRADCDWGSDPDAVVDGIFGPSHLPSLRRRDYVENSNDSHWLSNPRAPLEGFERIIGDERSERSLRTRLALRMVRERLSGEGPFTLPALQDLMFSDRNGGADLMQEDLVSLCRSLPVLPSSSGPVGKGDACEVLARWDGRHRLTSSGSVLFRRWQERALKPAAPGPNAVGGGAPAEGTWRDRFDPSRPVETPRELNTANPVVQRALGDAVRDLRTAGIPLDAAPRDVTFAPHRGPRIALHGAPGADGVFNAIDTEWKDGKGYAPVDHGATFLMATELRGACPPTRTLVAYSQSADPTSAFYSDQIRLFAASRWVRERYCAADVLASPQLSTERLGCLDPTHGTGARSVAWLAPGTSERRAIEVAGEPDRRLGRSGLRWCVSGGGHVSAALGAPARRPPALTGRIDPSAAPGRRRIKLVATTSRRQEVAGIAPGERAPRRRWRSAGRGLIVRSAGDGRILVAGVGRRRVRWIGLARPASAGRLRGLARVAGLPLG